MVEAASLGSFFSKSFNALEEEMISLSNRLVGRLLSLGGSAPVTACGVPEGAAVSVPISVVT